MLEFTPSGSPARFGNGPDHSNDCFSFDFFGAHLGCDSEESDCDFTFTGMTFDSEAQKEVEALSQTVHVPACRQTEGCELQHVSVDNFKGLSSVLVDVKVDGEERTWWADDLELDWSDNSCGMANCRSQMRDTVLTKSAGKRWVA